MIERDLPQLQIGGTEFIVEVKKQQLREAQDPANTISFNSMRYMDTYYRFSFDPLTHNLPEQGRAGRPEILAVNIPQRTELDALGMSIMFDIDLYEVKGKSDFEIIVDMDMFRERLSGKLPEIDIANRGFVVDLERGGLYPIDNSGAGGITFEDLQEYGPRHGGYRFPFNMSTGLIEKLYDENSLMELPRYVVFVEIPDERILDPVGYAAKNGFEQKSFLMEHGLKQIISARFTPLQDLTIMERIREIKKAKERRISADFMSGRRKGRRRDI